MSAATSRRRARVSSFGRLARATLPLFAGSLIASACVLDFERFESGGGTTTGGGGGSVPVGCKDGEQSEQETDVDCGGPDCPACANGGSCNQGSDCASGLCDQDTCTPCESSGDCGGGRWCDPNKVCKDLAAQGESCSQNEGCTTGFCIDGVCCADSCSGLCMRCDLSGNEGTCSPSPAGTDPDDECEPPTKDCNGSGSCGM